MTSTMVIPDLEGWDAEGGLTECIADSCLELQLNKVVEGFVLKGNLDLFELTGEGLRHRVLAIQAATLNGVGAHLEGGVGVGFCG